MELPEIVNQIVDYIPAIDFSISYEDQSVSVFETTIRYLVCRGLPTRASPIS